MSSKPAPKKRGGRVPKLDPELVAAKLASFGGNIAATARAFDVHRSSLQELIEKRPSLQIVLKDARESRLDHAESALERAMINGEAWAVCFLLKTQGRGRGYIENSAMADLQKEFESLRKDFHELLKQPPKVSQ